MLNKENKLKGKSMKKILYYLPAILLFAPLIIAVVLMFADFSKLPGMQEQRTKSFIVSKIQEEKRGGTLIHSKWTNYVISGLDSREEVIVIDTDIDKIFWTLPEIGDTITVYCRNSWKESNSGVLFCGLPELMSID